MSKDVSNELTRLISDCMDSPSRDGHPKFYAALDAKFEELKWRRSVHGVTGEVDKLKAENAILSERVFALDALVQHQIAVRNDAVRENARLRETLEWIANYGKNGAPLDGFVAHGLIGRAKQALSRQLDIRGAGGAAGGSPEPRLNANSQEPGATATGLNPAASTHSEPESGK